MKRREFLLSAAPLLPAIAYAQGNAKVHRIGVLGAERDWRFAKEFGLKLRELGYVEGQNLALEYRYSPQHPDVFKPYAEELARLQVELIVAVGVLSIIAARESARSIPIVMVYGGDPVGLGFVSNLARPGGNVTGLGWGDDVQFVEKMVELVRAAMPAAKTLGIIWNLGDQAHEAYRKRIEDAAKTLGLRSIGAGIRRQDDIPEAFQRLKSGRADATLVVLDHVTIQCGAAIEKRAALDHMPLVVPGGFGYESAVIQFGPDISDQPKRAAEYTVRILDGARPGDLPVERSLKYALTVNLKAAKALSIAIPEAVLLRANNVIR